MPLRDADDSVTAAHYARAADVYDSAPFYSTAELNHETLLGLVVDGLALRAEHRLVDIGAGNGAFTNSLVQSVGGEWATIVEPSKEFMTGVHAYPSIVAVHASLEEWSKAERAAGAPPAGRFDRMLLKEVVHHLGDSNERHESLRQLRAHRLTPNARLLIVTRHQEQPQMPLFSAARKVWAEQQPSGDELVADLERAGFARVCLTSTTLEYTLPLDEWCALVRGRFWSESADASSPNPAPQPHPKPNLHPKSDPSRLSPTSPMPHSMRALPKFGEITRRAHAPRALSWTSLQSAIGLCLSARRLRRQWRFQRQPPRRWGEMR
jgi:cyclopropane fatty-acyl-phospholipid synthase-like methyltransferase